LTVKNSSYGKQMGKTGDLEGKGEGNLKNLNNIVSGATEKNRPGTVSRTGGAWNEKKSTRNGTNGWLRGRRTTKLATSDSVNEVKL